MELCPRQDDIWLHLNALRAGYKVGQIASVSYDFPTIPGSQDVGLTDENVALAQNDVMIARNYTEPDLELLRREPLAT